MNISRCGLKRMPKSLKGLGKMKAFVGIGNPWEKLDPAVIASWTQLNSLSESRCRFRFAVDDPTVVSHSPNLASIPDVSHMPKLTKLTLSHCPVLTASALPDLSLLPHLRDVKMNGLPLLDSLPRHLPTWGTGLHSPREGSSIRGQGLEVLDLGHCSLSFEAITATFLDRRDAWTNLRSLTLHSNPLGDHDYVAAVQEAIPTLQIIDAKRVKERKRKGEISETRIDRKMRERKEAKMRPSGSNSKVAKMRAWGASTVARGQDSQPTQETSGTAARGVSITKPATDSKAKKRKRLSEEQAELDTKTVAAEAATPSQPARKRTKPRPQATSTPQAARGILKGKGSGRSTMASVVEKGPKSKTAPKSESSVVKVINLRPKPATSRSAGIAPHVDLKDLLVSKESGIGLGVGGW